MNVFNNVGCALCARNVEDVYNFANGTECATGWGQGLRCEILKLETCQRMFDIWVILRAPDNFAVSCYRLLCFLLETDLLRDPCVSYAKGTEIEFPLTILLKH